MSLLKNFENVFVVGFMGGKYVYRENTLFKSDLRFLSCFLTRKWKLVFWLHFILLLDFPQLGTLVVHMYRKAEYIV